MNSPHPESRCPTHHPMWSDAKQDMIHLANTRRSLTSAALSLLRHGPMVVRGFPSVGKMSHSRVQTRLHRSQRDFEDIADLFIGELVKIGEQQDFTQVLRHPKNRLLNLVL